MKRSSEAVHCVRREARYWRLVVGGRFGKSGLGLGLLVGKGRGGGEVRMGWAVSRGDGAGVGGEAI
jgi:hypothetical protein